MRVQEDGGGEAFVKSSQELHEELASLYRRYKRMPAELIEYAEVIWTEIEIEEAEEGAHG